MVAERIEREIAIDAPIERVWAILTQPEHLSQWFGDSAEVDLRPGGAIRFGWPGENGTIRARVERVEAPRVFSYRWARPFETDPAEGNSTLVEFTLTVREGGGTLLRVVESGFPELAWSEEEKGKYLEGNVEGWARELDDLLRYVRRPAS